MNDVVRIPIKFVSEGSTYHVADVCVNNLTKDIYYVPKDALPQDIGRDLNYQKVAGKLDHVSFHSDGNVHTKYKEINRAKNHPDKLPLYEWKGIFPEGLIPKDINSLTPMLIDSLYHIKPKEDFSVWKGNEDVKAVWDLGTTEEFSILVFFVHLSFNPKKLHFHKGFKGLKTHDAYLNIPVFEDWKVLVFVTLQTLPKVYSDSLSVFGIACSAASKESFFRNLVVGPNQLAFQHLFLGRSILSTSEMLTQLQKIQAIEDLIGLLGKRILSCSASTSQ